MITREEIRAIVVEAAQTRVARTGQGTEPMLRRALAMAEDTFGPDSEAAMAPLEELARVLHLKAGCGVCDPEGLEFNERAYAIAVRFPGAHKRQLVHMMDGLGHTLTNTEVGAERGLRLILEAVAIVQADDHLADLESWMVMGAAHVLALRGRAREAVPFARRHLELESRGDHGIMQVYARLGLAHILLDAGEVSEALDHLRQVGADGVRLGRPNIVRKAEQIAVDAERRLKSARSTS